jgi:alpha-beta hydrolase superfamily lysophospholipase
MMKLLRWLRKHPIRSAVLSLLLFVVLVNLLAFRHAWTMTHFAAPGSRTPPPEQLSAVGKLGVVLTGVRLPRPVNDRTPDADGLTYETHTISGGPFPLEAWYVPHPQPRGTVLLFHGYAACKSTLLPEAKAFHDLGFACLLIDFPGSGGSGGDDTTIGYREAEDVVRTADFARLRWPGRLILFGQSMGAAAVLRAVAVHGIRADALVLECPFDRLLTTVEARFRAMRLPTFPGARLLTFWGGVQHGFDPFAHNPVDYARSVTCPALLLHAANDPRVAVSEAEAICANLAGPKRLHVFAGLGHQSFAAVRPEEWKEEVADFLGR